MNDLQVPWYNIQLSSSESTETIKLAVIKATREPADPYPEGYVIDGRNADPPMASRLDILRDILTSHFILIAFCLCPGTNKISSSSFRLI
jgi:hypothetical protein